MAREHVEYVRRRHPAAASRTGTLKRLARDLPGTSGTLAERVASLHLADVELEPWEDVDDPAGGTPEVFHDCAVEIHELLSRAAPGLGRRRRVKHVGIVVAAARAGRRGGRIRRRADDHDGARCRTVALRPAVPASAASPTRRSASAASDTPSCTAVPTSAPRLASSERTTPAASTDGRSTTWASTTTVATPPQGDRGPEAGGAGRGVRGGAHGHPRSRRHRRTSSSRRSRTSVGRCRRTSAATATASVSPGCPVPKSATSNAWPLLISKVFPTGANGRAVAIVAENTPSGQYDVTALSAAAKSVKFRVAYAKTSLGTPATPDYDAVAQEVVTSNNGNIPDAVFVLGGVVERVRHAAGAHRQGIHRPLHQPAPVRTEPGGARRRRHRAHADRSHRDGRGQPGHATADHRRAEGRTRPADRPVGGRGVLVGRPLPRRRAEGGQEAHARIARQGGQHASSRTRSRTPSAPPSSPPRTRFPRRAARSCRATARRTR